MRHINQNDNGFQHKIVLLLERVQNAYVFDDNQIYNIHKAYTGFTTGYGCDHLIVCNHTNTVVFIEDKWRQRLGQAECSHYLHFVNTMRHYYFSHMNIYVVLMSRCMPSVNAIDAFKESGYKYKIIASLNDIFTQEQLVQRLEKYLHSIRIFCDDESGCSEMSYDKS